MSTELRRIIDQENRGGFKPMAPLDVYASGLSDESTRVDAIATVSCGRLVNDLPKAARKDDKQWLFIHGDPDKAPGLAEALAAGQGRRLTIAFPWDDPSLFIQQRFALYSKSALKAYGDEKAITAIQVAGERVTHHKYLAGSDEYEQWVKACKVSVSVYFALARWGDNGPQVTFPDGLGMYRLRFTSRNSLRNILATLEETARMTQGRIAGIPFDLTLDFRQVAGPDGKKRDIPVFTIRMRPPTALTSDTFRSTASAGLAAGKLLQLAPPSRETLETAVIDGPLPDVTDEQVERLERGGWCDQPYYTRLWHSVVRNTPLAGDKQRHMFIGEFTNGFTNSLATFLSGASPADADELIGAVLTQYGTPGEPEPAQAPADGDEYERLYGDGVPESQVVDIPVVPVVDRTPTQNTDAVDSADALDASDGETMDNSDGLIDFGYCLELYENFPFQSALERPKSGETFGYYQDWFDRYQRVAKETGGD